MTKVDIDAMTSNEWLNYREELLEGFYARGNVLKPNVNCTSCDPDEEYTCFACECDQLNQEDDRNAEHALLMNELEHNK